MTNGQVFNWIKDEVLIVAENNILKIYSFE